MNPSPVRFNLYLDDSGQFRETSTNPSERATNPGNFPSQLVGFLTPSNTPKSFVSQEAEKIIKTSCRRAGIPMGREIHGSEIKDYGVFQILIQSIVREISASSRSWRPIRLVNEEKIKYDDRISIYTNMVAELMRRIFQQKSKEYPNTPLIIDLTSDEVWLQDKGIHIDRSEYKTRINEYVGRAAVWHGLANEASLWSVGDIRLVDSATMREIQICDLLSSASKGKKDGFERCSDQTKKKLRKAFDVYDYSMMTRDVLDRIDVMIKSYSYGLALISLTEILLDKPLPPADTFGKKAAQLLNDVLDHLVKVNVRGRDPQLTIVISWLDQLIGQQRTLASGYKLTKWLQVNVEEKLRDKLRGSQGERSLDWFKFALHRWALTAANHLGAVNKGQVEAAALSKVAPLVAKHFEHSSLLIDGLIAQAVHQTDCFDFQTASLRMREVVNSLDVLSDVFPKTMPKDFKDPVSFELKGRALGTLMQSEVLASQGNQQRLNEARRLNDAATSEFSNDYDRARQFQYRAQLETIDGNFSAARKFLVKSLLAIKTPKPTDYSHQRLAQIIEKFSDTPARLGFALLHWLRIGANLCLSDAVGIESERREFITAFNKSVLSRSRWCQGKEEDYPAHGILRRTAVIYAAQNMKDEALATLNSLRALTPFAKNQLVLAAVLLAAQAEVASLLYGTHASLSLSLLHNADPNNPGLKQMLLVFEAKTKVEVPTMWNAFKDWARAADDIIKNTPAPEIARKRLTDLSKAVDY